MPLAISSTHSFFVGMVFSAEGKSGSFHSFPAIFTELLRRMLADLALPAVAATEVERMVGKGTEHLIASVLHHVLALAHPEHSARQVVVNVLFSRAWASYQQHDPAVNGQFSRVYPGVVEGLDFWTLTPMIRGLRHEQPAARRRASLSQC